MESIDERHRKAWEALEKNFAKKEEPKGIEEQTEFWVPYLRKTSLRKRTKPKKKFKKTKLRKRNPPPLSRVGKVKHVEVPREIPDGILEKVQREQEARRERICRWRKAGKAAEIIEARDWYLTHPELDP